MKNRQQFPRRALIIFLNNPACKVKISILHLSPQLLTNLSSFVRHLRGTNKNDAGLFKENLQAHLEWEFEICFRNSVCAFKCSGSEMKKTKHDNTCIWHIYHEHSSFKHTSVFHGGCKKSLSFQVINILIIYGHLYIKSFLYCIEWKWWNTCDITIVWSHFWSLFGPSVIHWCVSVQAEQVAVQQTHCDQAHDIFPNTCHIVCVGVCLCEKVAVGRATHGNCCYKEKKLCWGVDFTPEVTDWFSSNMSSHLSQLIGWFDKKQSCGRGQHLFLTCRLLLQRNFQERKLKFTRTTELDACVLIGI